MESSSSTQPVQEQAKTTWIERERQKKSVIVIEPNIAEATNLESKSGMLALNVITWPYFRIFVKITLAMNC
jgi:hypothetical protein